MSKRVPVYLSEDEVTRLLSWGIAYDLQSSPDQTDVRLVTKLKEELITFNEEQTWLDAHKFNKEWNKKVKGE